MNKIAHLTPIVSTVAVHGHLSPKYCLSPINNDKYAGATTVCVRALKYEVDMEEEEELMPQAWSQKTRPIYSHVTDSRIGKPTTLHFICRKYGSLHQVA